jgi:hypothetical protein
MKQAQGLLSFFFNTASTFSVAKYDKRQYDLVGRQGLEANRENYMYIVSSPKCRTKS